MTIYVRGKPSIPYGCWIRGSLPLFSSIHGARGNLSLDSAVTLQSRFSNRPLYMMCRARVGWREACKPIPKTSRLVTRAAMGTLAYVSRAGGDVCVSHFGQASGKIGPYVEACFFREHPRCRFRQPTEHFQGYIEAFFAPSVSRAGGNIRFSNFGNPPEKIGQYVAIF